METNPIVQSEISSLFSLSSNNVNAGASPEERVRVLWGLIETVVDDLDSARPEPYRLNLKKFMLHLAWHEGDKIRARVQGGNGPARSFYQMERSKAVDALEYADRNAWIGKLADAVGATQAQIRSAKTALEAASGPGFPNGNLIKTSLEGSDLFGTYMARIALKREPGTIGTTPQTHADYWADYWKKVFGPAPQDRATLVPIFVREVGEADALIPDNLFRPFFLAQALRRKQTFSTHIRVAGTVEDAGSYWAIDLAPNSNSGINLISKEHVSEIMLRSGTMLTSHGEVPQFDIWVAKGAPVINVRMGTTCQLRKDSCDSAGMLSGFGAKVLNNYPDAVRCWTGEPTNSTNNMNFFEVAGNGGTSPNDVDVDHVQDPSGQWWKCGEDLTGIRIVAIERSGDVRNAKCKTNGPNMPCPE